MTLTKNNHALFSKHSRKMLDENYHVLIKVFSFGMRYEKKKNNFQTYIYIPVVKLCMTHHILQGGTMVS